MGHTAGHKVWYLHIAFISVGIFHLIFNRQGSGWHRHLYCFLQKSLHSYILFITLNVIERGSMGYE